MAHNTAKCHIYIGIVKRSIKYISLTKCYNDMGSFRIFGIVLKYNRKYCVFVVVYRGALYSNCVTHWVTQKSDFSDQML